MKAARMVSAFYASADIQKMISDAALNARLEARHQPTYFFRRRPCFATSN
jgi:hypothetical protein